MKSTLCYVAWWEVLQNQFSKTSLAFPISASSFSCRMWKKLTFIWKYLGYKTIIKWKSSMPHPVKPSVFKYPWNYLLAFINIRSHMSVKEQARHGTMHQMILWTVMAQNCKQFSRVSHQNSMSNECNGSL